MGAAPMPDGTGVRDGLNVMDRAEAHGCSPKS
jgi:UDP-glucose 4-epimerase